MAHVMQQTFMGMHNAPSARRSTRRCRRSPPPGRAPSNRGEAGIARNDLCGSGGSRLPAPDASTQTTVCISGLSASASAAVFGSATMTRARESASRARSGSESDRSSSGTATFPAAQIPNRAATFVAPCRVNTATGSGRRVPDSASSFPKLSARRANCAYVTDSCPSSKAVRPAWTRDEVRNASKRLSIAISIDALANEIPKRRTGWVGRRRSTHLGAYFRITSTGQWARRMTRSATDPINSRVSPVRPCDGITINSAERAAAWSATWCPGSPTTEVT